MEVKLSSLVTVENFQAALRAGQSGRKLYVVTRQEYKNVPRTVLEVFSPFLATLFSSVNYPEETPTIIFPEIKSETLKHLVDLLQLGSIQVNSPAERRRETILEILELANILNIEMTNLTFDAEDSVHERLKQESVDHSDELLLLEENLFCQQLLEKEYFHSEQTTSTIEKMVEQVKKENTTAEYFENMTIDDYQVKSEEKGRGDMKMREDQQAEDAKAVREEGELSEEDEDDDAEVFTFNCRFVNCRFVCSSRKELLRHRERYHREERRGIQSSRSSNSSYPRYPSSEGSKYKQMKYQHRYKTQEYRTRVQK